MIANLYVDHMMSTPPVSSQEIWNATNVHSKLFSEAASRIGLTPDEYKEFRSKLLDGKALYVKLPKHFDAMSGNRRGSVYAVRNAFIRQDVRGWRVALADGNTVYIPQMCGNIALLKGRDVAVAPRKTMGVAKRPKFTQAVAQVPKEVEVTVTPTVEEPPVSITAPIVPAVASATAGHGGGLFFLLPIALGGILAGSGGGGSTAPVAPCQPINTLSFLHI